MEQIETEAVRTSARMLSPWRFWAPARPGDLLSAAVYAALTAIAGRNRPREYYEPDPFATEFPFVDSSWPRY